MAAEDQSAASDATEQTEPEKQAPEQIKPSSSFEAELLKVAAEEGIEIGLQPGKPEGADVTEDTEETEVEESKTEPEAEVPEETPEEEEELKPAAEKKGEEWPDSAKQRVAEETAKRKRAREAADKATERAEQAEAQAAELQRRLAAASGPAPTEDQPFIDIQDTVDLDRLERSYEQTIDLADDDPEALVAQLVKQHGEQVLEKYTPEQLVSLAKKKAERAVRRQIPERRKYLDARAQEDAKAFQAYDELAKPDSEFRKEVLKLTYRLLTGQAQKEPDVLIWVADAIAGRTARLAKGNGADDTEKIIASARQKIAPASVRTRSLPERRTSSSDLAKAEKELKETGSVEAGEKLVAAIFSKRGATKRLEASPD